MSDNKSFETSIQPRFCETDALGHVSNTVLPVWFEHARDSIFRAIHPSMTVEDWPMIVAHVSVDYIAQIYVQNPVKIITNIARVGNKSFTVAQKAYQDDRHVSSGECVIVYFDYEAQKTTTIPSVPRKFLEDHLG